MEGGLHRHALPTKDLHQPRGVASPEVGVETQGLEELRAGLFPIPQGEAVEGLSAQVEGLADGVLPPRAHGEVLLGFLSESLRL
ncbi:hypothetical protein TTHNP4_00345 (plasmid) [Thermus thermophilus]|uniref:Uncharacterized protein n=1 Tax=Thermus thermophilus TaxID=274 RepID=A0A3P4AWI8_THETH|nr:hypothetical protein [Thermus thermophilus]VCU54936.1 hypothetical protein TTHNP4_00345 [Thermus thermophilus]